MPLQYLSIHFLKIFKKSALLFGNQYIQIHKSLADIQLSMFKQTGAFLPLSLHFGNKRRKLAFCHCALFRRHVGDKFRHILRKLFHVLFKVTHFCILVFWRISSMEFFAFHVGFTAHSAFTLSAVTHTAICRNCRLCVKSEAKRS